MGYARFAWTSKRTRSHWNTMRRVCVKHRSRTFWEWQEFPSAANQAKRLLQSGKKARKARYRSSAVKLSGGRPRAVPPEDVLVIFLSKYLYAHCRLCRCPGRETRPRYHQWQDHGPESEDQSCACVSCPGKRQRDTGGG